MRHPSPVNTGYTETKSDQDTDRAPILHTVSKVVEQIKSVFVVNSSEMSLSDSQSNTIPKTLAKRTSCNLDAYPEISGIE